MPAEIDNKSQRLQLPGPELLFGTSAGMGAVREEIEQAAHDNLPVLIEGESGTGKETMARFLHENSGCADEPFLKLNCGVMATLLEERVFRFERTTASNDSENESGSIIMAAKGTFLLDEIDGLDRSLQRKLAQTLDWYRYRPIQGREDLVSDARFICATTIDMESELKNRIVDELLGCFVHRVRLLPLRERRGDIPQLCEYLLAKCASDFGRPVPRLSSPAVDALQQWKWPGNIRELENWIARIVIFGVEEVVGLEFRRQLAAGMVPQPKYHRVSHLRSVRTKRLRNHS